jgi:hypothetical protein
MGDDTNEPVHLVEDAETGDRFLVYGTDRGLRLDIRYEGDTLWMTQAQIGQLFGRDQSVISRHVNNVLEEGNWLNRAICKKCILLIPQSLFRFFSVQLYQRRIAYWNPLKSHDNKLDLRDPAHHGTHPSSPNR